MRLIVDSLIALMLVGILAGVIFHYRQQEQQANELESVHAALARLYEQAAFRGAMHDADVTTTGFPRQLRPAWFEGDLPVNVLVPLDQPWLDIAPTHDKSDHPPDPVITGPTQAGFWYNPNRGIFRARVMPQLSEYETLQLYNRLNSTSLKDLPDTGATDRPAVAVTVDRPVAAPSLAPATVTAVVTPRQVSTAPGVDAPAAANASANAATQAPTPAPRGAALNRLKRK